MADNIAIVDAAGATRTVSAHDVGGGSELLQQRVQLVTNNGADVSSTNGLPMVGGAPNPIAGTITANGQTVVASMAGMGSTAFAVYGAYAGVTLAFEACFDLTQTTWFPLLVSRIDSASTGTSFVPGTNASMAWSAAADGGMTYARVRATAYTSGTANVIIAPGAMPVESAVTVSGFSTGLNPGNNRIGYVTANGIWQDATTAALAAGATFTGAGRDLFNVAANTSFNSSSTYASEYRVSAESDQPGTLYVEMSRDNATFRRMYRSAAAQAGADASTMYTSEIIVKPSWRYARAVYVNGATLQGHFTLQEALMASV